MKTWCVFLILLPFYSIGQIFSGQFEMVYIDSTSTFIEDYNLPRDSNSVTTIITFNDGKEVIQVVRGDQNLVYEKRRDTIVYYFTKDFILSKYKDRDFYRLFNLKDYQSMNITLDRNGNYEKKATFRMYEDYGRKLLPVKHKVINEEAKIDGLTTEKVTFEEKIEKSDSFTYRITTYLTDQIAIPTKMFLNYPFDSNKCPIRIEQIDFRGRKNIVQLINFQEKTEEEIIQLIDPVLLEFLQDK